MSPAKPKARALLWVDLETTGGDEKLDDIIEVGALLTDFELKQIARPFQHVAYPRKSAYDRMMADDVVRAMHEKNGLLEACRDITYSPSLYMVENLMLKWLSDVEHCEPQTLILAGSGVSHFDQRFIQTQMPRVNELLRYATMDIGVVRRFLRMIHMLPRSGNPERDPKNHRALDDISLHLEEARQYRNLLQNMTMKHFVQGGLAVGKEVGGGREV